MKRIILASSSPRRRQILSSVGIPFEVIAPDVVEEREGNPVALARRLARRKALSVWRKNKKSLVIGADTLVFINDKVIGKPRDEEEAFRILSFLSGRWHKVVTAVCIISEDFKLTLHDIARVKFRNLCKKEIEAYIESGEPMDKAGAYGIQELGSTIVEEIRGNFYTVMGLPIHRVYPYLKTSKTNSSSSK